MAAEWGEARVEMGVREAPHRASNLAGRVNLLTCIPAAHPGNCPGTDPRPLGLAGQAAGMPGEGLMAWAAQPTRAMGVSEQGTSPAQGPTPGLDEGH